MSNPTDKNSTAADSPARAPRAFQVNQEPVTAGEQAAAPEERPPAQASSAQPVYEDLGGLPSAYHEDTLYLVARDPRWLFAYWEFDVSRFPAAGMQEGVARFFLKVTRGDGEPESSVEINPDARNWYVPVSRAGVAYSAEIGFHDAAGAWRSVVRSGSAQTPPDELAAESQPVDFATVPAHLSFERLLELVQARMAEGETLMAALARIAGEGRSEFRAGKAPTWSDEQKRLLAALLGENLVDRAGMSSADLDHLLRKHLQEKLYSESASGLALGVSGQLAPGGQSLFSAFGASWSAQPFGAQQERGFYMHVNAEIIFYGGTHPDAAVTVNGAPIQLGADGSFRYHFTLGDGDFEIPIVATSPDGVEQRSATLSFKRATARIGDVKATSQPAGLDPLIGRK